MSLPSSSRCAVCPRRDSNPASTLAQPTGPDPAQIMLIGDAPGKHDHARGHVFAGATGTELTEQYLPLAGLDPCAVYLTNAYKCTNPPRHDNPETDDAVICARHWLPGELRQVRPQVVVIAGSIANQAIVLQSAADVQAPLSAPEFDLEMQHGLPYIGTLFGYGPVWIVPTYHPAAGLRDTEYMIHLQHDYTRLRNFLRGGVATVTDRYPKPYYAEITTAAEIDQACLAGTTDYIALDTEYAPHRNNELFCVTFSTRDDLGFLIRAHSEPALKRLNQWLQYKRAILHNWFADAPVLAGAGVIPKHWIDTQQLAYESGYLPQALKVLAYRLLGMRMREFEDVTRPYAIAQVQQWVELVIGKLAAQIPTKQPRVKLVLTDEQKYVRGVRTKVNRLRTKVQTDQSYNPWKLFEKWPDTDRALITSCAGEIPRGEIAQVPFPELLIYACDDARATFRLYPVLKKLLRNLKNRVQGV